MCGTKLHQIAPNCISLFGTTAEESSARDRIDHANKDALDHSQLPANGSQYALQRIGNACHAGTRLSKRGEQKRGEKNLLIKSPPASGKSRALMFIALDKLGEMRAASSCVRRRHHRNHHRNHHRSPHRHRIRTALVTHHGWL